MWLCHNQKQAIELKWTRTHNQTKLNWTELQLQLNSTETKLHSNQIYLYVCLGNYLISKWPQTKHALH